MYRKTIFTAALIAVLALALVTISGCESLRFAPTEPQKQAAFQTHLTARTIEAQGADPHSPAAKQVVAGTAASLVYTGPPASLDTADFDTTLAQAQVDSAKRPTSEQVFDAAEKGLSLAAELAILFGVGGAGFGGKKLLDWILLAREKSKALQEIVKNNEQFKQSVSGLADSVAAKRAFKQAQAKQSPSTRRLVTELK